MILQSMGTVFSADNPVEFIRVFRAVSLDTAGPDGYNLGSDTRL